VQSNHERGGWWCRILPKYKSKASIYHSFTSVMMSLCKGETGVQEKVFSLTKITEHHHTPAGLFLRICALFHCEIVVIIFL
jgi:hypothetical protein